MYRCSIETGTPKVSDGLSEDDMKRIKQDIIGKRGEGDEKQMMDKKRHAIWDMGVFHKKHITDNRTNSNQSIIYSRAKACRCSNRHGYKIEMRPPRRSTSWFESSSSQVSHDATLNNNG